MLFWITQFILTAVVGLVIVAVTGSLKIEGAAMAWSLTGVMGGTLVVALGAAYACSTLSRHKMFPLAPVRLLHLGAIICMILPAAITAGTCSTLADGVWQEIVVRFPALGGMDSVNTMEQVSNIAANVPFPVMLLCMAIIPAITEEIVFRGLIGRGLVARRGIVSGIVLTSILFAIAHMHPVHAAGVLPLGIIMHVLYVTTRSMWAPMLYHFCNNAYSTALAYMLAKSGQLSEAAGTAEASNGPPWWIAVVGLATLGAWCFLLFESRTRLVTTDGNEWDPGYESTDTPRHEDTRPVYARVPVMPLMTAIFCTMLFFAALVVAATQQMAQQATDPVTTLILLFC